MPKIEITQDEQTLLDQALETEIKSAKRAQNSGKNPQIKEVYAIQERTLQTLKAKIGNAK